MITLEFSNYLGWEHRTVLDDDRRTAARFGAMMVWIKTSVNGLNFVHNGHSVMVGCPQCGLPNLNGNQEKSMKAELSCGNCSWVAFEETNYSLWGRSGSDPTEDFYDYWFSRMGQDPVVGALMGPVMTHLVNEFDVSGYRKRFLNKDDDDNAAVCEQYLRKWKNVEVL